MVSFSTGFLEGLKPRSVEDASIKEISLLHLKKSAAHGAAYLAAKEASLDLCVDHSQNITVFFHKTF